MPGDGPPGRRVGGHRGDLQPGQHDRPAAGLRGGVERVREVAVGAEVEAPPGGRHRGHVDHDLLAHDPRRDLVEPRVGHGRARVLHLDLDVAQAVGHVEGDAEEVEVDGERLRGQVGQREVGRVRDLGEDPGGLGRGGGRDGDRRGERADGRDAGLTRVRDARLGGARRRGRPHQCGRQRDGHQTSNDCPHPRLPGPASPGRPPGVGAA